MKMEMCSWKQVEQFMKNCNTAIIPMGATENHGTHLALGTDFFVPQKLADLIDKKVNVLITPCMPYGISDHHDSFPGTITIGYDAFYALMTKITEKLYRMGIRRFIFLNGHGGNEPALQRIGVELNLKGAISAIMQWWQIAGELNPAWKGGHGAGQEVAAMLAINPNAVHMDLFEEFAPVEMKETLPHISIRSVRFKGVEVPVPRDMAHYFPQGWYGADHPKKATIEWGRDMLEAVATFIAEFIKEFEEATI